MKKVLFGLICLLVLIPNVKANEFDDFKKEAVVDETIEMPAIKPKTELEAYRYFWSFLGEKHPDYDVLISNFNEDFSEIELKVSGSDSKIVGEGKFKLKWVVEDPSVTKIIDSYKEKIAQNAPAYKFNNLSGYLYKMDDMKAVSLYFNAKDQYEPMYNIVGNFEEFNALFDNEKVSYLYYSLMPDSNDIMSQSYGDIIFKYDGIYYGRFENVGGRATRAIYIPDETENTPDAYIEAASKRLKENFPNETFEIKKVGNITDNDFNLYETQYEYNLDQEFGDAEKVGNYYYEIKNGEKSYYFLIVRDSSKIPTVSEEFTQTDEETSVTVKTTSKEVPSDTILKVEKVLEESDAYKKAYDVLKFKEAELYDITLYSETLGKNITKLETGEFSVTVPIKESLRNKNLVAYYIDENNKIEEHPITISKEGMGTFTTNHFSTYVIAEKVVTETEPVPKTYDSIITYLIIAFVSLACLTIGGLYLKKQND